MAIFSCVDGQLCLPNAHRPTLCSLLAYQTSQRYARGSCSPSNSFSAGAVSRCELVVPILSASTKHNHIIHANDGLTCKNIGHLQGSSSPLQAWKNRFSECSYADILDWHKNFMKRGLLNALRLSLLVLFLQGLVLSWFISQHVHAMLLISLELDKKARVLLSS